MANSERGEVAITIPDDAGVDREYTLKLSTNAVVDIQDRLGKTLQDILAAVADMDFSAIRALVYVLVQKHHKAEIDTFEAAGDLIDRAGGVQPFFAALQKLVEINSDGPGGASADPRKARRRQTGRAS